MLEASTGRETNLVADPTSFIGRRMELDQLRGWLSSDRRLVTLVGAPGTGKTRLARRLGELGLGGSAADWSGGVWFVDLSEATTLEDLLHATASVLGAELVGDGPMDDLDQLGRAISARGPILLVLARRISAKVQNKNSQEPVGEIRSAATSAASTTTAPRPSSAR